MPLYIYKFYHKYLFFSFLTAVILTSKTDNGYCQLFDSSQNPPGIKWRQISTANFNLIYPSGMQTEADRMANVLSAIIKKVSLSYHKQPRKIAIILQNQGTTANGFVQLAPRRSEFFTTPSQEFDYQDWLNSLAVHELRHVIQFDKLTGKLKAPFFEELALAIFGITLPPWFYEGDAVAVETALTNAGRGRQPEFDLILRTNTLSGRKYSYSKNFMGSVKDFPPGYYQLGYYMTSKLRRDHGGNIMDSLLTRIAANPIRPYNLSNSVKKFAGISTRQLHDSTINELEKLWKQQQLEAVPSGYPVINKRKDSTPVNYYMPVTVSSNTMLAIKQGKGITPVIVKLDTLGNETRILKIGTQEDFYFRYAAGKIVWDEARFDLRYQKRSFNVINIFNLSTKHYKQLTHHTRLFAPTLSPDGNLILAVDVSYANQISLVVLNALTGKELKRYNSPMNYMLQTPAFNATGEKAVVVAVGEKGKSLYELNLKDEKFTQLLPFQQQLLSKPAYLNANEVIFKAHYNGIDNLYKLRTGSANIVQVTSVKFGAYNPSFDQGKNRIIFNNYQATGYDIAYVDNHDVTAPVYNSKPLNYIGPIALQEGNKNIFDSIPLNKYAYKPFREFKNLFYFHSLRPIAEESSFFANNYNIGLKLQSDNQLNTLSFYTGYRFNNALKKGELLAGFTYSKYFPVLNVSYLNQARLIYQRRFPAGNNELIPVSWRENEVEMKINIPLLFNRLNYIYNSGAEVGTAYTNRYNIINKPANLLTVVSFPMLYRLYFSRNSIRSGRDLAPQWGQNISLVYRNFPFDNNLAGELLTLKSTFYFPGIMRNHSFQTSFNYQKGIGNYEFTIDIPRVSGYANLKPSANLSNTLLTDYSFPLFYPDWELGPLAYIKRFTAGLFADFENIGINHAWSPRTFGAEIKADMNLLRFYLPNFQTSGKIIFVNEKPKQNPIFEASILYSF